MYRLEITYTSGQVDVHTCRTFRQLSRDIDAAMATPGFYRYVVTGV